MPDDQPTSDMRHASASFPLGSAMLDRLRELNPWWTDPQAIRRDRHLRQLEASPFQRPVPLLHQLQLNVPIVYTLRGPRQVGKTTTAKLLIRHLLAQGIQPTRILYYAFDLERDPDQVIQVVRQAQLLAPASDAEQRPERYLILDEISSVPEWQRAIKYLRDHTASADDFFLLTGSVASDVRRGAERLPGRRGPAADLDRILLPLSFSEFVAAADPSLPAPPLRATPQEFVPLSADLTRAALAAQLYAPALQRLLERYAQVGGFPAAVRDHLTRPLGEVSEETMRSLWDVVAGDVSRMGRDPALALRHLERLVRDLGSPLSWNSLAQSVGVATRTAEEYIRLLAEAFQVLVVPFWDTSRATTAPLKGRKLYPFDPLLLHFPALLTGVARPPEVEKVVEGVVGATLFRTAERDLIEAFNVPRALFYWRSARGNEVDFLVGPGTTKLPIEVKYRAEIRRADSLNIRQAFGQGLLLSRKDCYLEEPVKVIPAAVFLWLLDG